MQNLLSFVKPRTLNDNTAYESAAAILLFMARIMPL